jgi:hypothetical protein
MARKLIKIAQYVFPRANEKEALVGLSAVVAGTVGAIATVVTVAMILIGH